MLVNGQREGETTFEKWVRNITGGAILLFIGWIGSSMANIASNVHEMGVAMSRIDSQVTDLRSDMKRIQQQNAGVYMESDAIRDFSIRDAKMKDLNERIRSLEGSVYGEGSR